MKDFSQLKKNLKKDFSQLKKVKVVILADTTTQFIVQALRGMGFEKGFDLQIWEAGFDQIERQVFALDSELYEVRPEIVIVFKSSHKLLGKYNQLRGDQHCFLASNEMELINNIYLTLIHNLKTKVIYYNYTEIDDSVFGNYANKTESSFLFQLRKLNYELMIYASKNSDLHLCDISGIQNHVGKDNLFKPSVYINAEMVINLDVLPKIASKTIDIILALTGNSKKCIVLDLDNILWGGVIGDDGLENIQIGSLGIGKAFSEFQYWLKKLKNRGIILSVCSKNNEATAKIPFEKHPEMVLCLEDFAVFVANWDNKVTNIRKIRSILNISFDSMVFIDDSPFERNFVRENIPEINVPELPQDPADYLEHLYGLNLFETASFTIEDSERTKYYQTEAQRNVVRQKITNEDDFLKSLNMLSLVEPFNKFNTPRIAQLFQRSNQFNLRTVRYTEDDIEKLAVSKLHFTFAFTLEDKFGNNGLICAVILKKENNQVLFIDSWVMSCRVLKRGMEHFVLNTIADFAKENGYTFLKGEYIPTAKNEIVKDHYHNLGFEKSNGCWKLCLINNRKKKSFVNIKPPD